jgi:CRISPR-associated protein Cas1
MANADSALMPARMINEWAYCPRLAVLEHLHGEWAESAETEDGHRVHRNVDQERGAWPLPEHLEGTEVARSIWMSAAAEGITARLDLVEAVAGTGLVRPIDFKRGSAPDVPEGAYEPERLQVAAQAIVLRANGYRVEEGALWFDGSRRRVRVAITDALVERTLQVAAELRAAIDTETLPPPLENSPKCNGCSLAPICLPDEINLVREDPASDAPLDDRLGRRLVPARDDDLPLYVQTQGARVGVRGQELVVLRKEEELGRAPLPQTSQLSVFGNVQVSTQALQVLIGAGKPVAFFSRGGWFYGTAQALPHGNVFVRRAQYRAADSEVKALEIVRRLVAAKLKNQRTLLRRNSEGEDRALDRLDSAARAAEVATSIDQARGHEGDGAAAYFAGFPAMLSAKLPARALFDLNGRNRRPPRDPTNAVLGFCYALLVREWTSVLAVVGLDPFLGFLHTPRHGRAALALDLMEEFRPIVADSVVLSLFNTGEISEAQFVTRGGACNLTDAGRRTVLEAWERRMDALVTHPVFGYRISYRRVFEVQARLFGRFLLGEIPSYPAFLVR